jgi:hypothetical protein
MFQTFNFIFEIFYQIQAKFTEIQQYINYHLQCINIINYFNL